MPLTIIVKSLNELPGAASAILDAITRSGATIVAFDAEMGAGKTTLIGRMAEALGASPEEVNSPSFSIVNEYMCASGHPLYHFDLYRLESPEDGLEIGIEDYFDSGELCLVEWPERIGSLLPADAAQVVIEVLHDEALPGQEPPRRITFTEAC